MCINLAIINQLSIPVNPHSMVKSTIFHHNFHGIFKQLCHGYFSIAFHSSISIFPWHHYFPMASITLNPIKSHGFHWVPGSAGWPHHISSGASLFQLELADVAPPLFRPCPPPRFRHRDKVFFLAKIWWFNIFHAKKHWSQQKSGIHEPESESHQQKIDISSITMWFCQQERCFNRQNTWFNQQSCKCV